MQEHWIRWHPLEQLHVCYSMDALIDANNNSLLIELLPFELFDEAKNKRRVLIFFENEILSYRVTDEGNRLRTWQTLTDQYGTHFYSKWTFFTVQHSRYIELLCTEYPEVLHTIPIRQYTLLCDNPAIDILTYHEPKVHYIEEQSE